MIRKMGGRSGFAAFGNGCLDLPAQEPSVLIRERKVVRGWRR